MERVADKAKHLLPKILLPVRRFDNSLCLIVFRSDQRQDRLRLNFRKVGRSWDDQGLCQTTIGIKTLVNVDHL